VEEALKDVNSKGLRVELKTQGEKPQLTEQVVVQDNQKCRTGV
jgi:hypothetical protein